MFKWKAFNPGQVRYYLLRGNISPLCDKSFPYKCWKMWHKVEAEWDRYNYTWEHHVLICEISSHPPAYKPACGSDLFEGWLKHNLFKTKQFNFAYCVGISCLYRHSHASHLFVIHFASFLEIHGANKFSQSEGRLKHMTKTSRPSLTWIIHVLVVALLLYSMCEYWSFFLDECRWAKNKAVFGAEEATSTRISAGMFLLNCLIVC